MISTIMKINQNKKYILIFACGRETVDLVLFFKKKDYQVIGVDKNTNAPALIYCDHKIICELDDVTNVISYLKSEDIDPTQAISPFSDNGILPSYLLNLFYGKTNYNEHVFAYFNKKYFRQALKQKNIDNPSFICVKSHSDTDIDLPVVVKPIDSAGSRGVSIVLHSNDLSKAVALAKEFSKSDEVLIEQYINGTEYSFDGFVCNSKIIANLFYYRTKILDIVASRITVVSKDQIDTTKILDSIGQLISKLNYENGPLHIEFKINNGKIYYIDFAVRGGGFGLFRFFLEMVTGFDSNRALLDCIEEGNTEEKPNKSLLGDVIFIPITQSGIIKNIVIKLPMITESYRIELFCEIGDKVEHQETDAARLAGLYIVGNTREDIKEVETYLLDNIQIEIS